MMENPFCKIDETCVHHLFDMVNFICSPNPFETMNKNAGKLNLTSILDYIHP